MLGELPNVDRYEASLENAVVSRWHLVFVVAVLAAMTLPSFSSALPANPQRPFNVQTCEEAKARFREALTGSPLISLQENIDVTALARDWTDRLCGPTVVQEILAEFEETKNCNHTK